jgi:hypothetical protein
MPSKYFKSGELEGSWLRNVVWELRDGINPAMELVASRHAELQREQEQIKLKPKVGSEVQGERLQIELKPKADSDVCITEKSEPRYVSRSRASLTSVTPTPWRCCLEVFTSS